MWCKYNMLYYEKWCMLFSAGKCKADTLSFHLYISKPVRMWAYTGTNNAWICSWADIHRTCTTFFGVVQLKHKNFMGNLG